MIITVDLPGKGPIQQHFSYDELLQWITLYDNNIVEEILYIKKMQKALQKKEYVISSQL